MILKIEGKRHFKGTSKSGNQYDFTQIHVLVPAQGVEGKAAVVKNIYDSNASNIIVGQYYDFDIDLDGNIIGYHPAKP